MTLSRRIFLAGAASLGGLARSTISRAEEARILTPEMFGAKGDGVTNDSRAMARLAQVVNANGGGIVSFRKTTYLVGAQEPAPAPYSFLGRTLLEFAGCTRPLVIEGNGARLKCADGLRYGTFDRLGRPTNHPMPFSGSEAATPYRFMIRVERCTGPVEIADLELDGNLPGLEIGGEYGDSGRQIPASGLGLLNNAGPETVRNLHSHHHGQDGLYIDGIDHGPALTERRIVRNARCEYNGRQGCSIVGGAGYAFEGCKFNHTGRSRIESAPAAGVDIEAEGKTNRNFRFTDCEFVNNVGCGMVADSGDSDGAVFNSCTFVGTTAWSAWPFKPNFRFHRCRFVGALVRAYGNANPARAAQFYDCLFTDDPALAPQGKIYLGGRTNYPIADLSDSHNVLFANCRFLLGHGGLLPWSWFAIYQDCILSQRAAVQAYPKGKYLGTSRISGNVDLYGTTVLGTLILNGRLLPRSKPGTKAW
jgi:hypothetical protein